MFNYISRQTVEQIYIYIFFNTRNSPSIYLFIFMKSIYKTESLQYIFETNSASFLKKKTFISVEWRLRTGFFFIIIFFGWAFRKRKFVVSYLQSSMGNWRLKMKYLLGRMYKTKLDELKLRYERLKVPCILLILGLD